MSLFSSLVVLILVVRCRSLYSLLEKVVNNPNLGQKLTGVRISQGPACPLKVPPLLSTVCVLFNAGGSGLEPGFWLWLVLLRQGAQTRCTVFNGLCQLGRSVDGWHAPFRFELPSVTRYPAIGVTTVLAWDWPYIRSTVLFVEVASDAAFYLLGCAYGN
jgi:hypothetical protein